ncbi:MAG: hypothetical protein Q8910_00595 [Bacteroidota bacterium]|nr:hypothetical protein [Bacteroidota bacterium]
MIDIDRYFINVPGDMDYEEFTSPDGAYVIWDDVEPLLEELEELRAFYSAVEYEVNWEHRRLKR